MNINNKGVIISIVIISIVTLVVYFLIKFRLPQNVTGQSINDAVMPSLNIENDPLKNKPNINPAETSNPFRSVKTNPFQ